LSGASTSPNPQNLRFASADRNNIPNRFAEQRARQRRDMRKRAPAPAVTQAAPPSADPRFARIKQPLLSLGGLPLAASRRAAAHTGICHGPR
jgi:hypothetical protein